MDTTDSFIFVLGGLLSTIGRLLILTASIIWVIKQKNGATILILVSQVLAFLMAILNYVLPVIAARDGVDFLLQVTKLSSLLAPVPQILFAIGLLWFVVRWVKNKKLLANSK